ncbi:hypothetical protein VWM73_12160, partial [Campylobacter coli]
IGIFMANIMQPGHGMNLDPKQLDTTSVQKYISQTTEVSASSDEFASFKDQNKYLKPCDLVQEFKNVLYLGTFSKLYGLGGLRIG